MIRFQRGSWICCAFELGRYHKSFFKYFRNNANKHRSKHRQWDNNSYLSGYFGKTLNSLVSSIFEETIWIIYCLRICFLQKYGLLWNVGILKVNQLIDFFQLKNNCYNTRVGQRLYNLFEWNVGFISLRSLFWASYTLFNDSPIFETHGIIAGDRSLSIEPFLWDLN